MNEITFENNTESDAKMHYLRVTKDNKLWFQFVFSHLISQATSFIGLGQNSKHV
jgi:hypothetical protein